MAELFIEPKAQLWRNKDYAVPLLPGGMTTKEQPAITHMTTSWLETDEGAALALMHMPEFICYEPAKPKNEEPEGTTGSGDLAKPEKLEPEPSEGEGSASDVGSAQGDSSDSDDNSEEDRVETHKRQVLQSDLDILSSTDSEEGNAVVCAELVNTMTNIAKFDKKVHDSGIGDTSDGGTVSTECRTGMDPSCRTTSHQLSSIFGHLRELGG